MIQQWNEVCTIKVSEVKTPNVKDNSVINYLWDKIHSHVHMQVHGAAVCEDSLVRTGRMCLASTSLAKVMSI